MINIKRYKDFVTENVSIVDDVDNFIKFQYNDVIDYTLLDNAATDDDIINLCEKAMKFGTKSVCVMPKHVRIASDILKDSDVLVCTVISFPDGTNSIDEKENETRQVINDGADEVDMVLNYIKLKEEPENSYDELIDEVELLTNICHSFGNKTGFENIILKVIVESGLLTDDLTELATEICIDAGADFIKTSTGMVSIGALN